jgi:hypothetical protein
MVFSFGAFKPCDEVFFLVVNPGTHLSANRTGASVFQHLQLPAGDDALGKFLDIFAGEERRQDIPQIVDEFL